MSEQVTLDPPRSPPPEADAPGQGRLTPGWPVLLVLGGGAATVLALLLWPFLPAIVLGSVAATLALPAHRRLEAHLRPSGLAAMTSTVMLTLLVVLPALALMFLVGREALAGIDWLSAQAPQLLQGDLVGRTLGPLARRFGLDPAHLSTLLAEQLRQIATLLASRTFAFVSGLGGGLLQAGAGLFTLYYLLKDRERLLDMVRWLVPLDARSTESLMVRARDVTYATVYGNLLVAAVQGAIGGVTFWALGLQAATLWGSVMAILSLIPVAGAPLVWGPAAVLLLVGGHVVKGIILLAVGFLVISTVDNVLRAVFVSGRAQLHPLVVFFSVLGGLVLFGAAGIVIGPVVFVVSLAVLEMARLALGPARMPRPGARSFLAESPPAAAGPGETAPEAEGAGGP